MYTNTVSKHTYTFLHWQKTKIVPAADTIGYLGNHFLEMLGSQGWGLLCFGSVTPQMSSVICRETSQMFPLHVRKLSHFDREKTKYWCSYSCQGNESRLNDCPGFCLPVNRCSSQETVLDCYPGTYVKVFRVHLVLNFCTVSWPYFNIYTSVRMR